MFFLCVFAVVELIKLACYQARLLMRNELNYYICLVDAAGASNAVMKTTAEEIKV